MSDEGLDPKLAVEPAAQGGPAPEQSRRDFAEHPFPAYGQAPGIELEDLLKRPTRKGSVQVTCVDYGPDRLEAEEVTDFDNFLARHRPEWTEVRWINVAGLTDMEVIRALAEKYELHPLAIEDLFSRQRPKADDYPGSPGHPPRLFVVAWMVRRRERRLRRQQVCFFVGRQTLLTFEQAREDVWDPVRQRLQSGEPRLRSNDVSFLLYSLLDAIVDNYFPILETYSERLERLEREVLTKPTPRVIKRIYRTKRELIVLRRSASAMRELIHQLQRQPHECLSETTRTYFRDVYDHVIQVFEFIETYREFVTGLAETYMSAVSNRMNEIMKTLTIVSTIFVPLTFLAGVYGMNMPIPENQSPYMYPVFWVLCGALVTGMLFWVRHRQWY